MLDSHTMHCIVNSSPMNTEDTSPIEHATIGLITIASAFHDLQAVKDVEWRGDPPACISGSIRAGLVAEPATRIAISTLSYHSIGQNYQVGRSTLDG